MYQSPEGNILTHQGKIKMLTRGEKMGGLAGLDMVCRWTFFIVTKALFKNRCRQFFRNF